MKFIRLYCIDGTSWSIAYKHWEEIFQAYEQYQLYGTTKILELSTPEGSTVIVSSSRISDFSESTPESRQRAMQIGKELQAETGFRNDE